MDPRELLDRYVNYIERFAAVICHGMGRTSGFHLTVIHGGEVTERRVDSAKPPEDSVSTWTRKLQSLPPFTATLGADAHIALLSPLGEPICNAVKTLLN